MDIRLMGDLRMRKQEKKYPYDRSVQGMIYEDVFGRRLWKPRGAGVYLNIYRKELRCHSPAQFIFGISVSQCRSECLRVLNSVPHRCLCWKNCASESTVPR